MFSFVRACGLAGDLDQPERLPGELVGDALAARATRAGLYALGRRREVVGGGLVEMFDRDAPALAELVHGDRADDLVTRVRLDFDGPSVPERDEVPLGDGEVEPRVLP